MTRLLKARREIECGAMCRLCAALMRQRAAG
jgi:hypothetical protein